MWPCLGMSEKYFALGKLIFDHRCSLWFKMGLPFLDYLSFLLVHLFLSSKNQTDTPHFWEISPHHHTWLCIFQLHIYFPSWTLKVPHMQGLFHIAFVLLGCKMRIAKKDSVQCGCDLGPLPLVVTESRFILPGAWWKIWGVWPKLWGGYKM